VSTTTTVIQIEADALMPSDAAEAFLAETTLAGEIGELWSKHVRADNTLKHTNEELKLIRQVLSKKLHEMKQLLAQPGRNGKWAPFLNQHNIARATADRYVKDYEKLLNPPVPAPEPPIDVHQPATESSADNASAPQCETNRLSEAISPAVGVAGSEEEHAAKSETAAPELIVAPQRAKEPAPEPVTSAYCAVFTASAEDEPVSELEPQPALPPKKPPQAFDASELTPGDAYGVFDHVWPALCRVLTTQEAVHWFVYELTTAFNKAGRELKGDGLLVLKKLPNTAVA
jgi:hypothetical protein